MDILLIQYKQALLYWKMKEANWLTQNTYLICHSIKNDTFHRSTLKKLLFVVTHAEIWISQ